MKITQTLLLFLIASIIIIAGAVMKITHQEIAGISANTLLSIGLIAQAVLLLYLLIVLILKPKNKS